MECTFPTVNECGIFFCPPESFEILCIVPFQRPATAANLCWNNYTQKSMFKDIKSLEVAFNNGLTGRRALIADCQPLNSRTLCNNKS